MKKQDSTTKNILFILLCLACLIVNSQNQSQEGEWSNPIPFGIVPVAAANLPDGRLLTWSSQFRNTFIESGDGMTYTEIFDPTIGPDGTALGETVAQTNHDMFCPGINNLADGRILSAGGTTSEKTSIYDPETNQWSTAQDMHIPRGYQGNTTLANGAVFTVGGSWSQGAGNNGGKDAEIWSPETGWISLPFIKGSDIYNATDLAKEEQGLYRVDNHVWLWPAPNGHLFHAGPSEMMHWIDTNVDGGQIVSAGNRGTDTYSMKGTTVMFDIGKILKVGGAESYGANSSSTTPAKNNSYVIDLNNVDYGDAPLVTQSGNLAFSRTMHNSTVLPNGQVLVTGGLDRGAVFTDVGARYEAELFDPTNNTWTTVASMSEARTYHSVSILLTDGRVFVGGGGLCDDTDGCENHFNAEIYSPPYLFDNSGELAIRPNITAPDTADYETSITVTGSNNIQEFSLIRFSAATHSTNNEQRRIPLNFSGNGTYNVSIPNRNLLPPGYYMLFGIDNNGVPSVAETIKIGNAIPLNIQDPNLIVDLKFDDGSSTTATDSSSYGNDAFIEERDNNGNTIPPVNYSWETGLFGGAIEFDGLEHNSNSLLFMPYSSSLATLNNNITVMAWVYRNSAGSTIPQTGKVANVGLLSHDYTSTLFFGFHNTMYKWAFETDNGPVDLYAGNTPMDTWVHIAATYDGKIAKLYANGELISWKERTGTIPFLNDGSLQSHFTTSGFFDNRTPAELPGYANQSGITDEINGKIDEFKIYNKILGEEEIKNVFKEGQLTGNTSVPDCPNGTITAQFRVGTTGSWQTGNNINAVEGDEIYIRAQVTSGNYYVTTPQIDGPTFNSNGNSNYFYQIDTSVHDFGNPERNNGLVDQSNVGQFVLTTSEGCSAVINLNVIGVCGPQDTAVSPEYQINGVWSSGLNSITVNEGDLVVLSALPNDINGNPLDITITLPDGNIVDDNYSLGNVTTASQGSYILTSEEGCSVSLNLNVQSSSCSSSQIKHQINGSGSFVLGSSEVTIDEGDSILLSMDPDGTIFSITGPNDNNKPLNNQSLNISNTTTLDDGTYTFTTDTGCIYNLLVNITPFDCNSLGLQTSYSVNNGAFVNGSSSVTITEGDDITLALIPNGTSFSISGPNSKPSNTNNLVITNATASDEGTYTYNTPQGCAINLNVNVESFDCNSLGLQTSYSVNNGAFVNGSSS
uniref:galactose oxidase-like domain-containing protein n=1 Tax=uncultured Maribacter sp. TaxID=431308 RepID=UPI00261650A1